MDKVLAEYINEHDTGIARPIVLPFMHSCEGYSGKEIILSEELKATHCHVFDTNLLYFFYGKPSYPVAEKTEGKRTDDFYCPVCFIVDPDKVMIHRVFPFDSGAFMGNRYGGFIHRGMKLENFELDNNQEAIQTYISVLFHNNENYINGLCKQRDSDKLEVQGFLNMLNAKGSFEIDERANTVEVISKENVSLIDAIECLILPKSLLKVKEIREFLSRYSVNYKTYNIRRLTAPCRYNEIVFQLAMEYMDERGEDGT